MENLLLKITELSCQRSNRLIFQNLTVALNKGDALIVVGENGSGKSSLLRLLAGIATPASGKIEWRIATHPSLSSSIHYLNHSNGIKLGLTVTENLQLTARLLEMPLDISSMMLTLTNLKLSNYADIQVRYLSAGQQRRIALCKLFLFKKPVWLLDEPLTALDSQTQLYFYQQLQTHLQEEGIAIISSHHATIPLDNVTYLRLS